VLETGLEPVLPCGPVSETGDYAIRLLEHNGKEIDSILATSAPLSQHTDSLKQFYLELEAFSWYKARAVSFDVRVFP
jgi:hypothetical protein